MIEATEDVYGAAIDGDAETLCELSTTTFTVKLKVLTGASGRTNGSWKNSAPTTFSSTRPPAFPSRNHSNNASADP